MNDYIFYAPYVPENWKIIPNKYVFRPHSKKVGKDFRNYNLLSLTKNGVILKDIESNEGKLPASFEGYQTVERNDLILCLFDLDVSAVFSGLSEYQGMITSAYDVYQVNTQLMMPKFAGYWFANVFSERSYSVYSKSLRHTIAYDSFKNIPIAIPSLETQSKIVSFLSEKIKTIDSLISNETKQIEKLKEYRQAIITKAVTKGLDPNAPMKDSGVEWIGKIPCTWQVKRIKDFLEKDDFGIKCGPFGSALTGKVISNGEYNIYGQWNVIGNDFSIRRNTIAKNDYLNLISYSVRPKDILVSMMGSIGRCALVPEKIHPGIMDSHIIKIRLNHNEMNPYFFLYEYDKNNSTIISEFYNRAKKGFIMDGLNTSIIKSATFVSPPIDIQKKVVDYLDSFCSKVDAVISFKESKIQKLQTYKKSLIYECVTGKKRVSL